MAINYGRQGNARLRRITVDNFRSSNYWQLWVSLEVSSQCSLTHTFVLCSFTTFIYDPWKLCSVTLTRHDFSWRLTSQLNDNVQFRSDTHRSHCGIKWLPWGPLATRPRQWILLNEQPCMHSRRCIYLELPYCRLKDSTDYFRFENDLKPSFWHDLSVSEPKFKQRIDKYSNRLIQ